MKVTSTNYTIASYCEDFTENRISVNRDYQRSRKVWPASARSFLIDTILSGYPIPKILLREITDFKARRTRREVVDGQQRTEAIVDFYNDDLAISLKDSKYVGKRFSTLDSDAQQAFVSYSISADVFANATDQNVREVFRRINSYTVPLNKQERRHAIYQGDFKWFVLSLTNDYSQALKDFGVVSEMQINRMKDAEFITEVLAALNDGIQTSAPTKLDALYKRYDSNFPYETEWRSIIDLGFEEAFRYRDVLDGTKLTSRNSFYSLLLSFANARYPVEKLKPLAEIDQPPLLESPEVVRYNLALLSAAVSDEDPESEKFSEFRKAEESATNTKLNRETKFRWFTSALASTPLE